MRVMKTPQRSKDHLVEIALQLFAEDGFAAVTEDQLLSTSKVSKGVLVYHFHDKTGVLREILRQHIPLFLQILPPEPFSAPPEKNLIFIIQQWTEYLESHTSFWKCYFPLTLNPNFHTHIYYPTLQEFYQTYHRILLTTFTELNSSHAQQEVWAFEVFRKGLFGTYVAEEDISMDMLRQLWLEKFRLHTSTSN